MLQPYILMFKKRGIKTCFHYFFQNHLFDIWHGTDTHERLLKKDYKNKQLKNFKFGVLYMSSWTWHFNKILNFLSLLLGKNLRSYKFYDIGSGKGKGLILIGKFLRKKNINSKIYGIEYDKNLLKISLKNLSKFKFDNKIYLKNIEATQLQTKFKNSIIVLFNPFGKKVLKTFLKKIQFPGNIIIYTNPIHNNLFLKNNFKIIKKFEGFHPNNTTYIYQK